MIIARVVGGISNQMVIYAAALAVALEHDVPVKIDITSHQGLKQFGYSMDKLEISGAVISPEELKKEFGIWRRSNNKLFKAFDKKFGVVPNNVFQEKSLAFSHEIFEQGGKLYLKGDFISYKYYSRILNILQKEFKPKVLSERAKILINEVKSSHSVSVHLRRGDYASNLGTTAFHGLLGVEYYQKCYEQILGSKGEPVFYIFSDDPEWAKKELRFIKNAKVISREYGTSNTDEMEVMKHCKVNVIANSGFSRWAALLNYCQSEVYMPDVWFKGVHLDTNELGPRSWNRVPSNFKALS